MKNHFFAILVIVPLNGIRISVSCCRFLPPAYGVRGKVMFWQVSVLPSIHLSVHRGGYPYPIMLCNISQNAMRQWGVGGTRTPPRGVPGPPPLGGCTWTPPGGGTQTPPGVGGGYPDPPRGVPGQVPPPARTEGVLTTRRAVCLLRSRRRTFLFCVSMKSVVRGENHFKMSVMNNFRNFFHDK